MLNYATDISFRDTLLINVKTWVIGREINQIF